MQKHLAGGAFVTVWERREGGVKNGFGVAQQSARFVWQVGGRRRPCEQDGWCTGLLNTGVCVCVRVNRQVNRKLNPASVSKLLPVFLSHLQQILEPSYPSIHPSFVFISFPLSICSACLHSICPFRFLPSSTQGAHGGTRGLSGSLYSRPILQKIYTDPNFIWTCLSLILPWHCTQISVFVDSSITDEHPLQSAKYLDNRLHLRRPSLNIFPGKASETGALFTDLRNSGDVDMSRLRPDKLVPTKIDSTWQLEVLDNSDP